MIYGGTLWVPEREWKENERINKIYSEEIMNVRIFAAINMAE
jgi:hypothetical protein